MPESQFLRVIRVWAALAWADGVIAEAERFAMKRLIDGAVMDDQERATAMSWLDTPVELDTENLQDSSPESRQGIYRAAARLAAVDQDVAVEEKRFLKRLREALHIDEQTARAIEQDIPGHEAG